MADQPDFLPPLIELNGIADEIINKLYAIFSQDFKNSKTYHNGIEVIHNKKILEGGDKEEGFWHVVTKVENATGTRLIDYPRAKRLPWAKPLMESPDRIEIKSWFYWEGTKDKGLRKYIWLEDYDYVIILEQKKTAFFWVTAFFVDVGFRKSLLRKYQNRSS